MSSFDTQNIINTTEKNYLKISQNICNRNVKINDSFISEEDENIPIINSENINNKFQNNNGIITEDEDINNK